MALSNTATPKYYGLFRDAVMRGEIPICNEIAMEMERIDELIANPGIWYDDQAVEGWIKFCENELTLTDGRNLKLLDSFKVWGEQIFGWYYFEERSIYEPGKDGHGGRYVTKKLKRRLIKKQYLIVGRGAAKSLYISFSNGVYISPSDLPEGWSVDYSLTLADSETAAYICMYTDLQQKKVWFGTEYEAWLGNGFTLGECGDYNNLYWLEWYHTGEAETITQKYSSSLDDLKTQDKTSVISAINELAAGTSSQSGYSSTPVQIGTWIDGMPVWRYAYDVTFSESEVEYYRQMKCVDRGTTGLSSHLNIASGGSEWDFGEVTASGYFIINQTMFAKCGEAPDIAFDQMLTVNGNGDFDCSSVVSLEGIYGYIDFVAPASKIKL